MTQQTTTQNLKKEPAQRRFEQAEGNGVISGDNGRQVNILDTSIIAPKTPENQLSQAGKAALIYATRLSWAVLPVHSINGGRCTCGDPSCSNPGKHPRITGWQQKATKDPATIWHWFRQWPHSNVGIATGEPSGFFVLDADGEQGAESLQSLQDDYGPLPDTVQAISGSGSIHLLFKHVDGIKNSVGKLAPNCDIRSTGGFIVSAPSLHISGRRYEWEASSRPMGENSVPIADAPDWLIQLILKRQGGAQNGTGERTAQPLDHWMSILQGLEDGEGRNDAAASLTGYLLKKNIAPEVAYMLIRGWNMAFNKPPLDEQELGRTFTSILKKDQAQRAKGGIRIEY